MTKKEEVRPSTKPSWDSVYESASFEKKKGPLDFGKPMSGSDWALGDSDEDTVRELWDKMNDEDSGVLMDAMRAVTVPRQDPEAAETAAQAYRELLRQMLAKYGYRSAPAYLQNQMAFLGQGGG